MKEGNQWPGSCTRFDRKPLQQKYAQILEGLSRLQAKPAWKTKATDRWGRYDAFEKVIMLWQREVMKVLCGLCYERSSREQEDEC